MKNINAIKPAPKSHFDKSCGALRRLDQKKILPAFRSVPTVVILCLLFVLPHTMNAEQRIGGTQALLAITAPQRGETLNGNGVTINLQIARTVREGSLSVQLNGKPITNDFRPSGDCTSASCPFSATVNTEDGLRKGVDVVRASVEGQGGSRDREKVGFKWQGNGTVTLTEAPFELSSAIGFTTLAPGGQASGTAWIQLYSNALRGGTASYPTASQSTCTTTYQVLVLDRQNVGEASYNCYDSDSALSTALSSLDSSDLVVVGTTLNHNAGLALNTSSIGGTNYANVPAAQLPQGYMAIGVGGASSGAAESYYLSTWLTDDWDSGSSVYLPQLNGILSTDSADNFNYHPTLNTTFYVVNTPGSTGPYEINVNNGVTNNTYVPPPVAGVQNGFWLLALQRTTLSSSDLFVDEVFSCDTSVTPTPCGAFYETGNADSATAQQQASALASALNGATSEELLFLVSFGTPFNGTAPIDLSAAVENLGGAVQSLYTISQNRDKYNYTLITSTDPSFTKTYPGGQAVVSSNLNVNQGQSGSVYGVLSRGLNNLYVPATVNQGNVLTDSVVADQSLYQIAWMQPQPWPAMDTEALKGAYRYLSYMVTESVLPKGAATDDIRSEYPGSNNTAIVGGQPTLVPYPSSGSWTDTVSGSPDQGTVYTFEASDMNTVASQLAAEFSAMNQVGGYMLGSKTNVGLRPTLISGNNAAVLAMLGAAATAASDLSAPTSAKAKVNPVALSNELRATMALMSIALPEAAPVLSVANATLWLSTASSPLDRTSTGIPSPFNDVTTTLATLATQEYQAQYNENTGDAFDQTLDNLYSDWYKLSTSSTNTATVWEVQQQSDWDAVSQALAESARVQFYSSIFASIYSTDVFQLQPTSVSQPSDIGSAKLPGSLCPLCENVCDRLYSSSLPSNGWVKHGPGPTYDFLILGGSISKNNTSSMSERFPSSSYLNTLFGTNIASGDLNLFNDQFFAGNSIVLRRIGNSAPGYSPGIGGLGYTGGLCYNF